MKIFILHGDHPSVPGHIMKTFATKASADADAAILVNLLLTEHTDDDDKPIFAADATAETWSDKCLEYRQNVADGMNVDLDALEYDDAGDVWIVEEELIGAPDIDGLQAQNEWLKSKLAHLQLPITKRDHDSREKHLVSCGMPEMQT